jgi:hypothetical protein
LTDRAPIAADPMSSPPIAAATASIGRSDRRRGGACRTIATAMSSLSFGGSGDAPISRCQDRSSAAS